MTGFAAHLPAWAQNAVHAGTDLLLGVFAVMASLAMSRPMTAFAGLLVRNHRLRPLVRADRPDAPDPSGGLSAAAEPAAEGRSVRG